MIVMNENELKDIMKQIWVEDDRSMSEPIELCGYTLQGMVTEAFIRHKEKKT